MVCWSCEREAGDGTTCAACGVVQPPRRDADAFAVLEVPRTFALDFEDVERRYKGLTRVLHPDRWAKADARARRYSLERSVQLNEAWRTLRDPVRRAEYLLKLAGREVAPETARDVVPPALLMEVMETREALAEARAAGDQARIDLLADDVRGKRARALAAAASGFATPSPDVDAIASALVQIRYYDRFLDEVAVHEEGREAHG